MEGISLGVIAAFAGLIALAQGLVKVTEKLVDAGVKKHRNGNGNRREMESACHLVAEDHDRILRMSDGNKRMEKLLEASLIEAKASRQLLGEIRDGQKIRVE